MNGDGVGDLVYMFTKEATSLGINSPTVYGISIPPPAGAGGFFVGDMNGDGILDVGIAYSPETCDTSACPDFSMFYRNLPNQVVSENDFLFPAFNPVTADFNNDGRPDVVSGNAVWLQTGEVSLSSTSINFGNQNVGISSAPQSLTLKNSGSAPMNITSIGITGANSGDFTEQNTCGSRVAINGTCTVSITFTPTTTGTRTASVTIADDAPDSPQTINVTGNGVAPAVNLSPSGLTFSQQALGTTSAAKTVTLTNSGTAQLNISAIAISGMNSADFLISAKTCTSTVGVGASCTISVKFRPTTTGSRTAFLSISDNASGSPQQVSLTGTGIAVTLSTNSLVFATQLVGTTSAGKAVTVTNQATSAYTISGITITGNFVKSTTCGTSIAAGASCTVTVRFKPTAIGSRTGSLTITDSDPSSPHVITLSGVGTVVSLSPTSLTFATQLVGTISASKSVTLTNHATTALTISSISTSGDFARSYNCPSSLAAGASCTIKVFFTPTAIGTRTGTLSVSDNGGGSPQTVALTGTGTVVTLSPTSLTFASQPVGTTSAAKTVTMTNNGSTALSISGITTSGDFTQINACGTSLAAGTSCQIQVRFHPTATGTRTGSLNVNDNGGGSPQKVKLTGTGT